MSIGESIQIVSSVLEIFTFLQRIGRGIRNNIAFWITNTGLKIKFSAKFLIKNDYKPKNFNSITNCLKDYHYGTFEKHKNYVTLNFKDSNYVFRVSLFPVEKTELNEDENCEIIIELINQWKVGFRNISKLEETIDDFEKLINAVQQCNFKIVKSYKIININVDIKKSDINQKLSFLLKKGELEVTTKNNIIMIHASLISNLIKDIRKVVMYWNSIR